MRKVLATLVLALLGIVAGCADGGRFNLLRPSTVKPVDPVPSQAPLKEDLVAYLNRNSDLIPGIQSDDIGLTCYAGTAIGIPVGAKLRAQGPRNFRMTADVMGNREVDLGSNDQEFWYWIKRAEPYQFFCSYQALEEGRVKQMPFPFQPDWVLEAMGMGRYGPAEKYELVIERGRNNNVEHYKLIEQTKSPQGVPVKKIIVFDAHDLSKRRDQPQVTDFLVIDERTGKELCSAKIKRCQVLTATNGIIARELELRWPEYNMKLVLNLTGVQVNQNIAHKVFERTRLNGVKSYDLATGQVDERIQPAGAVIAPPGVRY
jgi:hypothetical protein